MPNYKYTGNTPSPQPHTKPGTQNQYYTKYDSQLIEAYIQQQNLKKLNY